MDPETIAIIKATAPVVAPKALEITRLFYKTLFANAPQAAQFFNVANQSEGRQPQALANAVVAYASNIDNLGVLGDAVALMATKHCGLQVLPQHYGMVHDNLMLAVAEVLGSIVTPEIAAAWSAAVMFLAGILIAAEEKMYAEAEARSGGWRGWKEFTVAEAELVATDVKTFTFAGSEPFEFTAGQYLSVQVDLKGDGVYSSPRHYTVTSSPGERELRITVKKVRGGVVSGYLHDVVRPGMSVRLSPPFGSFVPDVASSRGAVLIGAGIGVTPMKAFAAALGDRCVKILQVQHSPECFPFRDYFEREHGSKLQVHLTSESGHCNVSECIARLVGETGVEHEFYVCGPTSFMQQAAHALVANGVPRGSMKWEAFSPQLSCPV